MNITVSLLPPSGILACLIRFRTSFNAQQAPLGTQDNAHLNML